MLLSTGLAHANLETAVGPARAALDGRAPARRRHGRPRRRRRHREVPSEPQGARHSLPRGDRRDPDGPELERRGPRGRPRLARADRRARAAGPPLPRVLMAAVLHLLKTSDASLARAAIAQSLGAGDRVTVVLLPGAARPELPADAAVHRVPDELGWDRLLELIFESDQVVTW